MIPDYGSQGDTVKGRTGPALSQKGEDQLTFIHLPANGTPTVLTCELKDAYRSIREGMGGLLEVVGLEDGHTLYLHE